MTLAIPAVGSLRYKAPRIPLPAALAALGIVKGQPFKPDVRMTRLLEQAAALGDYVVVGVNSDASVQRLKGPKRPINPAEARAEVLSALGTVNAVTVAMSRRVPITRIISARINSR